MTMQAFAAPDALAVSSARERETPSVPYEVCVYETRSGTVRKWLPLASVPDWERGVNIAGSWSVDVPIGVSSYEDPYQRLVRGLTKQDWDAYTTPWYFSCAICQGEKIWQAGPIIAPDYSGTGPVGTITGAGVWKLLTDKRVLLNPARVARGGVTSFDADVVFGTAAKSSLGSTIPAANKNLSLAGIAARIVAIILAEPGGDLPIDTAPAVAGTAVREYAGYDLTSPGTALANLAQDEGGPEQEFDPYFTTPQRRAVRFRHTVGNPRLGQTAPVSVPVWDLGRALVSVATEKDGSDQADRVFQRGGGMDRNTLIGFAENLTGVTVGPAQNAPLLETVDTTHSQVELQATISGYANATLATDKLPLVTLKPTVRLMGDAFGQSTRSPLLSQLTAGDVVALRLRDHATLPDGRYVVRVLRIRGNRDAVHATMDVQLLSVKGTT